MYPLGSLWQRDFPQMRYLRTQYRFFEKWFSALGDGHFCYWSLGSYSRLPCYFIEKVKLIAVMAKINNFFLHRGKLSLFRAHQPLAQANSQQYPMSRKNLQLKIQYIFRNPDKIDGQGVEKKGRIKKWCSVWGVMAFRI